MRSIVSIPFMAVLLTVLVGSAALAETIYVGDRLIVTLREIPEDDSPVITSLKSDDAVELLDESGDYYRVRTSDGEEGYIKKQYMTTARPKAAIIAELEQQIDRQKKTIADLKTSLSSKENVVEQTQGELNSTINGLKKQLADAEKELATTTRNLADLQKQHEELKANAGDVVAIVTERENLQKENDRLADELNALREENAYLLRTGVIKWFLAGAGVLFVGWMVGKSSRNKRRY